MEDDTKERLDRLEAFTVKTQGVFLMKKDSDLPWVVRLTRWALFLCGTALAVLYVAHCFKEWFL